MGEPQIDVNLIREQFIQDLQNRVDQAYLNRQIQHDTELGNTEEQLAHARKRKQLFNKLPKKGIINFGEGGENSGEVFIRNSHDYPTLLKIGLETLAKNGQFPNNPKLISLEVENAVNHEWEHSVPGLDIKGFVIFFGMRFYQDEQTGTVGVTPLIQLRGQTTKEIYQKIIKAPTNVSGSDITEI